MYSGVLSATYSESRSGKSNHYHDGHQLLYIVKGSVDVTVGGATECAEEGTLLLFSRFEEHSISVRGEEYKRYSLRIAPDVVNARDKELLFGLLVNRGQGFRRAIRVGDRADVIEHCFRRLTAEYRDRLLMHEEMLDALLRELLLEVCRMMPQAIVADNANSVRVVYQLQQRFENDYSHPFSLSDLAHEHHMSVSYLSHLFKETTGMSVMDYLFACRLLAAKRYLATSDMPIGEIVAACGFCDDSNFSRSFKQKTGMTPSEFRRTYRSS